MDNPEKFEPDWAKISVRLFVCIAGILGNFLVIFVIIVLKEYKKAVTHWYVLQLAIADSIFLLTLPFKVDEEIHNRWKFTSGMCKGKETILFLNYYASILFLVIMSVDRYIAVCHGFSDSLQKLRTHSAAFIITAVTWIIALIICIPVMLYSHKAGTEPNCTCQYRFPTPVKSPIQSCLDEGINETNVLYEWCICNGQAKNKPDYCGPEITEMSIGGNCNHLLMNLEFGGGGDLNSTSNGTDASSSYNYNGIDLSNYDLSNYGINFDYPLPFEPATNNISAISPSSEQVNATSNSVATSNTTIASDWSPAAYDYSNIDLSNYDLSIIGLDVNGSSATTVPPLVPLNSSVTTTTAAAAAVSSAAVPVVEGLDGSILGGIGGVQIDYGSLGNVDFSGSIHPDCHYHGSGQGWKAFLTFNFAVMFILPLFIMAFCYLMIILKLRETRAPSSRGGGYDTGQSTATSSMTESSSRKKRTKSAATSRANAERNRVTMMCAVLVTLFLVCWLPFHAVHMARINQITIDDPTGRWCRLLSLVASLIAYMNSALNPYLYNFLGTRFSKRVKQAAHRVTYSVKRSSVNTSKNYERKSEQSSQNPTAVTKIYKGRQSEVYSHSDHSSNVYQSTRVNEANNGNDPPNYQEMQRLT